MDWLIGIGRNKSTTNSRVKAVLEDAQKEKAYMVSRTLSCGLVANVTKDELQATVPVPTGVDTNEWLATNTLSFFKHITLVYDSVSEYCTPQNCTTVSNGAHMNFTWVDEKGKKSRLSAPQYIELVVVNIEKLVTDENIFPTKYDMHFPANFITIIKKIFRMLFHVLVHIYQSHCKHLEESNQLNFLNTVFIHFMYFQTEHGLLDSKEIQPLEDLIKSLCL